MNSRACLITLVLLVLAVVLTPVGSYAQFPGFAPVQGQFLAASNGLPVPGLMVSLIHPFLGRSAPSFTDQNGRFGWSAIPLRQEPYYLEYVPGGHRFECDPHQVYREVCQRYPDVGSAEQLRLSLEVYYGKIITQSATIAPNVKVTLKKGGGAIWHPQLPHGGSPAADPARTRRSMVFHCAPSDIQVYQHDVFFTHPDGAGPPAPRYGFSEVNSRSVAVSGDTAFQHG